MSRRASSMSRFPTDGPWNGLNIEATGGPNSNAMIDCAARWWANAQGGIPFFSCVRVKRSRMSGAAARACCKRQACRPNWQFAETTAAARQQRISRQGATAEISGSQRCVSDASAHIPCKITGSGRPRQRMAKCQPTIHSIHTYTHINIYVYNMCVCRWPKRAPRGAQEAPKTAPRAPKSAQTGSKRRF